MCRATERREEGEAIARQRVRSDIGERIKERGNLSDYPQQEAAQTKADKHIEAIDAAR